MTISDYEPLRILILEDDANLREELQEVLEEEGYWVDTAAHGQEAVDKTSLSVYDLLIVDVRMEGMDGLEALASVQRQGHQVASLVITGYATEEDSIRAVRLGVGDYLRKPFRTRDLLASVERLSARFREQQALVRRERELQALAWWAGLAAVAASRPEQLMTARRVARLAGRLAQAMELDAGAHLEVRLAALLSTAFPESMADWSGLPECPPQLSDTLEACQENWDGSGPRALRGEQIPLLSRILRVAANPNEDGRHRLDPRLWDAAAEISEGVERPVSSGRLLDLARTLMEVGDHPGARLAFQQAAGCGGPEQVQAWLGMARLELGRLDLPAAEALALKALALAPSSGPTAQARAFLEGALILTEGASEQALPALEQARIRLEVLGDSARASLAWVASGRLQGLAAPPMPALEIVLQPENEPQLAASLGWLFPALLEWAGSHPLLDAALARLCRNYAPVLVHLLSRGRLSPQARLAVLQALAPTSWGAEAVLKTLSEDSVSEIRSRALDLVASRTSGDEQAPRLLIQSFGNFSVQVGASRVSDKAWRGTRIKLVLAYLAATPRLVAEDVLVDVFWPEDVDKGKRGLYAALSIIRKALRGDSSGDPLYVVRHGDAMGLNQELRPWHDLEEFERLSREAQTSSGPAAVAAMRKASQLQTAPYLDGCYMDWAILRRESQERTLLDILIQLGEHDLAQGQPRLALEQGRRALGLDPLAQKAHLVTMKSHMALGQAQEAIRHYEVCCRKLKSELEMEPSLELVEAFHRARLSLP